MAFRILLLGLVGSGKSYLAQCCAELTGGIVLPFAKDVYRLAEQILSRPPSKSKPGDRELLKTIGTNWGREGTPVGGELEGTLDTLWARKRGYPGIWVDAFARHVSETP